MQGRKVKIGVQGGRIAAMNQMIPLGRGGLPEEAAGSVYLFCSPDSDYVSGQCLVVNGGLELAGGVPTPVARQSSTGSADLQVRSCHRVDNEDTDLDGPRIRPTSPGRLQRLVSLNEPERFRNLARSHTPVWSTLAQDSFWSRTAFHALIGMTPELPHGRQSLRGAAGRARPSGRASGRSGRRSGA